MSTFPSDVHVRQPRTRKAIKVEVLVCFLAALVMVAASFMTWLSGPRGSVTGWDMFTNERDSGARATYWFVVPDAFTNSDGEDVTFLTGLTTVISAVWLMVVTAGAVALTSRLRPLEPSTGSVTRLFRSLVAILFAFGLALAALPLLNAMWYFEGVEPDLQLRYGLVVLWIATLVGVFASLLAVSSGLTRGGVRGALPPRGGASAGRTS